MALKLVRKKKAKPATPGRRKSSEIKKFMDTVDVQLRLASGDKVKKGKGFANSWMVDGSDYGVGKILVPRAGNRRLYAKSALVVDLKQKNPPTKELKELRAWLPTENFPTAFMWRCGNRRRRSRLKKADLSGCATAARGLLSHAGSLRQEPHISSLLAVS